MFGCTIGGRSSVRLRPNLVEKNLVSARDKGRVVNCGGSKVEAEYGWSCEVDRPECCVPPITNGPAAPDRVSGGTTADLLYFKLVYSLSSGEGVAKCLKRT